MFLFENLHNPSICIKKTLPKIKSEIKIVFLFIYLNWCETLFRSFPGKQQTTVLQYLRFKKLKTFRSRKSTLKKCFYVNRSRSGTLKVVYTSPATISRRWNRNLWKEQQVEETEGCQRVGEEGLRVARE